MQRDKSPVHDLGSRTAARHAQRAKCRNRVLTHHPIVAWAFGTGNGVEGVPVLWPVHSHAGAESGLAQTPLEDQARHPGCDRVKSCAADPDGSAAQLFKRWNL